MKIKNQIIIFFGLITIFTCFKDYTFELILNGARPTLTAKSGNTLKIRIISLQSEYIYEMKNIKRLVTKNIIVTSPKSIVNFTEEPKGSNRGYFEFEIKLNSNIKGRYSLVFAYRKKNDRIPEKLFPLVLNLI